MPKLFRCLLSAATLLCAAPAFAAPELIDRIVASVDNHIILWSELNYRLRFEVEARQLTAYVPPDTLTALRQEVLSNMVDEQVLILKAQKDSLQIDPSEVEELLGQQFLSARSNMSDSEFDEMLVRVGLSERQLKTRYRKEIRHRLLYRQMRNVVSYRQHITRRDVDAYRLALGDTLPTQISLSHIRVKIRPSDEVLAEKRAIIEDIEKKLQAGADFAALAREMSEDPGSADNGGDLGCFGSGTLVPEFEEVAFELKPGELSGPVLSPYGYHLILLNEKREDAICSSHILVLAQKVEGDQARAEERLRDLRQRALSGEEFATLAREYSDDSNSAMQGGLWGTFPRDQVPAFLKPYLDGLKLDDISEPFFLQGEGFLFKINSDQATLEGLIREVRTEQAMRDLIKDYRQQIHIETRLDSDFLRKPNDPTGHLPQAHGTDQAAQ
ncbi:MAG: peptidylprolyl isomerase [Candidatus Latescibacterota bacterium]|jgi:peptidyl-prolyl cis-trans isomerase SurA